MMVKVFFLLCSTVIGYFAAPSNIFKEFKEDVTKVGDAVIQGTNTLVELETKMGEALATEVINGAEKVAEFEVKGAEAAVETVVAGETELIDIAAKTGKKIEATVGNMAISDILASSVYSPVLVIAAPEIVFAEQLAKAAKNKPQDRTQSVMDAALLLSPGGGLAYLLKRTCRERTSHVLDVGWHL